MLQNLFGDKQQNKIMKKGCLKYEATFFLKEKLINGKKILF